MLSVVIEAIPSKLPYKPYIETYLGLVLRLLRTHSLLRHYSLKPVFALTRSYLLSERGRREREKTDPINSVMHLEKPDNQKKKKKKTITKRPLSFGLPIRPILTMDLNSGL